MKKASSVVNKQMNIRKKTAPTQNLDSHAYTKDSGVVDVDNMLRGRYIKPNIKKDTEMNIWQNLPSEVGTKVVTDKHVKYFKQKKDEAEKFELLRLASQLIDPRNPETQEFAYAVFPDLYNVPEQTFRDDMAIQLAVRSMVRAGRVNGAEDIALIYRLIASDYVFDITPLWDYEGTITARLNDNNVEYFKQKNGYGLFNPYPYLFDESEKKSDQNLNIKIALLQRVFPNLRNRKKEDVMKFIQELQIRYNQIQLDTFGVKMKTTGEGTDDQLQALDAWPNTKDQFSKLSKLKM